MNKYQLKIISLFKPGEWLSYQDITKKLKFSFASSVSTKYYRAWLDLLAMGKFQESVNGTYRVNQ